MENVFLKDGIVVDISPISPKAGDVIFHLNHCFIFPGLIDVHVHLREPGFSYKETIKSGTMAAAHGGYTDVCAMPNLKPCPDTLEHLQEQLDLIRSSAVVRVHPYGTITKGENGTELSDMDDLSDRVIAFSDDGRGVQDDAMMEQAMRKAVQLNKMIAAHCEDNSLLNGGYIHAGAYAKAHGHRGICSASEYKQIERDLKLAAKTGVAYHVCHISTKESVELIRQAKKAGVNVTCETAPHYLTLCEDDLKEDGRFKMNPPLRSAKDKEALLEGLCDGTIDMIATDHAPHSKEEKAKGLKGSAMGIVGLETAFPVLYTNLVKTGVLPLEKLVALMSEQPGRRFGIETGLQIGKPANFTVYDCNEEYPIDPEQFFSKGKATPFAGMTVSGACVMTVVEGKTVWQRNITEKSF